MTEEEIPLAGVVILIGPCGSGKSSLGRLLAAKCKPNAIFIEGDDHHPSENVKKMSKGCPLNDDDREPWLIKISEAVNLTLRQCDNILVVVSCSALKKKYRDILVKNIKHNTLIHFVLLDVLPTELSKRLERRAEVEEHFMPSSLIESQLHDLEKPLINEGLGDRVILSVDEQLAKKDIEHIGNWLIEAIKNYQNI